MKREEDNIYHNERKGDKIYCPICSMRATKIGNYGPAKFFVCNKKVCFDYIVECNRQLKKLKDEAGKALFKEYEEFIKYFPDNDGGEFNLKYIKPKSRNCTYCYRAFTSHTKRATCSTKCERFSRSQQLINRHRTKKNLTKALLC